MVSKGIDGDNELNQSIKGIQTESSAGSGWAGGGLLNSAMYRLGNMVYYLIQFYLFIGLTTGTSENADSLLSN